MSWTNRCAGTGLAPVDTKIAHWARPELVEKLGRERFLVGVCSVCGKESRSRVDGTMRTHVNSALAKTQRAQARERAREQAVEDLLKILAQEGARQRGD